MRIVEGPAARCSLDFGFYTLHVALAQRTSRDDIDFSALHYVRAPLIVEVVSTLLSHYSHAPAIALPK